jgi:hypothetical protein
MKKNYSIIKELAAAFLLLISLQFSAQEQIIPDGNYQIFSSVHSEVMTASTEGDLDALMTANNSTDNNQIWTFTHQANNIYKIVNVGSGKTLGIKDGWCGQFGDVQARFENADANVEFLISPSSVENKYVIQIGFTTCNFGSVNDPVRAFDIQDGASGAQIQTFDVNTENPNQQFEFVSPGTLSTSENLLESQVSIFYNSNSGIVINNNGNSSKANIQVYSVLGQNVKSFQSTLDKRKVISTNGLKAGIYIVQLSVNNTTLNKKIIIN